MVPADAALGTPPPADVKLPQLPYLPPSLGFDLLLLTTAYLQDLEWRPLSIPLSINHNQPNTQPRSHEYGLHPADYLIITKEKSAFGNALSPGEGYTLVKYVLL